MKRIGVMGGTFDPVHMGHLGLAEGAAKELKLDKVIFMPAFVQPFKQNKAVTEAEHRINMLELAMEESEAPLEISTWEIDRGEISYSFDTMAYLKEEYPKDELWFIMGSDSMMILDKWYKGIELMGLCNFAVGTRPTNDIEAIEAKVREYEEKYGAKIHLMNKLLIPISSTDIRKKIEREEPIFGMVPLGVENYIYEQRLYT